MFGWGNSEYGQLRLATSEMQLHTPRHLPLPSNLGKIIDVAASGTACLILNGIIFNVNTFLKKDEHFLYVNRCWASICLGVWNLGEGTCGGSQSGTNRHPIDLVWLQRI